MTDLTTKLARQRVDRRRMLGGAAATGLGMFGGAMLSGKGALAAPSGGQAALINSLQDLPEGAAPVEQQILYVPDDAAVARVLDLAVQRAPQSL